ncbi:radical SAM protein [Methanoregula sp. UBA64]|uniref:radical SAM protein n=1 Tax=Methanoregula sp. UBA64 TaxID=1915554 RepID=UPI0025D86422|nr:radical SAM protein [Methanoregula sp. UBA64]
MQWNELKARLLSAGSARISGEPADEYIATSSAGPGAGGRGSVFFAMGSHRVKLSLNPSSPVEIVHRGDGVADLCFAGTQIPGRLARPGLHCPDQAFITVTESCIFSCKYCSVPRLAGKRKSIEEIVGLVDSVKDRISAISLTSGVAGSVEDEEAYVCGVIKNLTRFGLPIGVSIYPTKKTPDHLHALGVVEVKFNIEAATPKLFEETCPGLDYATIWQALDRSVELFGKGRVFSNLIIGLGETDAELAACIEKLVARGVVPVLRPLNPVAGFAGIPRPSPERIRAAYLVHSRALAAAGIDPLVAQTMCTNCAGCDLVPGRD